MERTALNGGQLSFQVIGPIAPMEPTVEWCPDFDKRWAFVTKRSSGDRVVAWSSSRVDQCQLMVW